MVQGGLKKVQGGLEPPLAPYFPRLCRTVKTGLETGLFFDTPCKPFGCFLKHVLLSPLSDAIDSGLTRDCEVRKLFRVAT